MKKIVLILLSIITIVSCTQEDTNIYSKDENINTWVKKNRELFKDITLSEISSYYGEQQRAIYRIISSENRKKLWTDKLNNLIDFYPNQREIFSNILIYIEKVNFDKGLNKKDELFFNEVIENGRKKYNWSDEFIGITFCSFEYYKPGKPYMIFSRYYLAPPPTLGDEKICNCKWGGMFACGSLECKDGGCKDDGKKGCGFLLMEDCTGICD